MSECQNCLMHTSVDPKITFDEKGVCNYCTDYYKKRIEHEALIADNYFERQIQSIKKSKRKKYDCILGISGGTDSSYVAYLLYNAGLNVLLLHCDNGWDTERAVENLEKIRQKTGFDLVVRKMDTEAFYAAQKSFLKARVVDIELLSDHMNVSAIYEAAAQHKISWIVTGENINTEFFMPKHWVHNKNDFQHIRAINRRFENADMSSFPKLGPFKKYLIDKKLGIKYFRPLDYIDYHKEMAARTLADFFDWRDHGGKHFESYFTIFFQCYILPEFFGIDKRLPHLSNLICSGVLTKEKAQALLRQPILAQERMEEVKAHVFSKLKMTAAEFQEIMARPLASHADYSSHFIYNKNMQKIIRFFKN